MIEISRSCTPEVAISLRRTLATVSAQEVQTVDEARAIERRGGFAFVDHTAGGQRSFTFEEKLDQGIFLKVPFYTAEYVKPEGLDHDCGFTAAWYELRGSVLFAMLGIDQEPPYWARELKQNFMLKAVPEVLEHHTTSLACPCGCDKAARVAEIKRIISRPAISQDNVMQRTGIDGRFYDVQRLVGFQPPPPAEMSVY